MIFKNKINKRYYLAVQIVKSDNDCLLIYGAWLRGIYTPTYDLIDMLNDGYNQLIINNMKDILIIDDLITDEWCEVKLHDTTFKMPKEFNQNDFFIKLNDYNLDHYPNGDAILIDYIKKLLDCYVSSIKKLSDKSRRQIINMIESHNRRKPNDKLGCEYFGKLKKTLQ